jgi:hypothetical protein
MYKNGTGDVQKSLIPCWNDFDNFLPKSGLNSEPELCM